MKLFDYQKEAVDFILKNKRVLVVLGTGKGKTLIGLEVAKKLINSPNKCVLVVCPKSLLGQWEEQLTVLNIPFLLFNYSALPNAISSIIKRKPMLTIVDEPKPLKSFTKTAELLWRIRSMCRIILDATPIENKLIDYWWLFRWLKPDVFGDLNNFKADFVTSRGSYKNLGHFRERIQNHVFSPKVAESRGRVLKFIYANKRFDFGSALLYRELCNNLRVALKSASSHPNALLRAMGKISKLRSFLGDINRGGRGKLSVLLSFLAKHLDRRGIIFVYKKDTAKEIVRRLKENGYKAETFMGNTSAKRRTELKEKFNDYKLQFLVATSAGERGLDLFTGNLVVHFDLPWTRASYDQRDRVSRKSSDQSVKTLILTLILKDSVEELIWSIIAAKERLMVEPFNKNVETLIIEKESWSKYLNIFLNGGKRNGNFQKEGEANWFTRG